MQYKAGSQFLITGRPMGDSSLDKFIGTCITITATSHYGYAVVWEDRVGSQIGYDDMDCYLKTWLRPATTANPFFKERKLP
jgi:hypothetical protein